MTTLTDTQVITASGGLVELGSTSWVTSPVINGTGIDAAASSFATPITISFVSDGSPIMVEFGAREQMTGSTASGSQSFVVVFLDGVFQQRITRVEQTNSLQVSQTCYSAIRLAPSAGSHTVEFKQFRVNANGQIGPGFARVSKIVQATQWPAVTTGTIICTSSTRPAAPFEGQTIYETDTDIEYRWTGSVWLAVSPAPSVRIKAGAAQTGIASGTWVKVTFPTSTVVNPHNFTVSNGTVTVPSGYGGMYAVQGQIQWDSNASGDRILAFGLAGGSYASDGISGQASPPTVSAYYRSTLSGLMQLNAGSSYTLWTLQGSGGSRSTEISFMENWLHLVKVS